MSTSNIIGRKDQIELFEQAMTSTDPEFIAVYGRRRIGKTFLVREFFDKAICFELIGIIGSSLGEQLENFTDSMEKAIGMGIRPSTPSSWKNAFMQLENFLESDVVAKTKGKRVVFLDELPWLNTPRSKFLTALQHFWNSYGSKNKNLILIVCGSAASWMIQHIVRSTGGLHNRLTRQIRLIPFTLSETKEYLKSRNISNLDNYMIIQLYMALGGIPFYLKLVQSGMSAAQVIDSLFFSSTSQLRNEYDQLYRSLFENSEQHTKVVEILSNSGKGISRSEILEKAGMKSGGTATNILEELEESGFIESNIPFGKNANASLFRLTDEYSLFYLKWVKPLGKRTADEGYWMGKQGTQKFKIWAGLSFENICLKHTKKIKIKLGISGIETFESPWRFQSPIGSEYSGAQIDLLIDRADGVINLVEMKFYESQFLIDAGYAADLKRKKEVFKQQTNTRKSIFLTIITSFGVSQNNYSNELEIIDIKIDDFF